MMSDEKQFRSICLCNGCWSTCLLAAALLLGCGRKPSVSPVEIPHAATTSLQTGMTLVDVTPIQRTVGLVDQLASKREAAEDSWDSEVLTRQLDKQLKAIAKWIAAPDTLSETRLRTVIDDEIKSTSLYPRSLTKVFEDAAFSVLRGEGGDSAELRGTKGFQADLRELAESLGSATSNVRVKFKLFRIEPTDTGVRSIAYFEASSQGENTLQESATWIANWRVGQETPKLVSVEVTNFEQTQYTGASKQLFADVTHAALGANKSYQDQVVPGIPFWMDRMSREFMSQFGHHGLAIGDVNGDGLDDLYVCDTGGLPNRLYLHQEDGTALDVSAESGVDLLEDSVGCLLVDLDNDGDQDLVIATDPLVQFAENDGTGKFQIRLGFYANTDSYSLCAADYDRDGDVDVYVCGYNARKQDSLNRGLPFPVPYHDANNGGENHLLRNDGGFAFVDVTKAVGLDQHNTRFSLSASWEDYDDDGDLDLYVANDFGRNCLFQNDAGRFTDVAALAGVEDHASGMSVCWSDFNRDGQMDVYVSNMFSAAGNRVTFQRRFADSLGASTVASVQRMARGNTLFESDGEGKFRDVSEQFAVTMGRWAWSSCFADLNNDGWQDLLVANGYVTNEETTDL